MHFHGIKENAVLSPQLLQQDLLRQILLPRYRLQLQHRDRYKTLHIKMEIYVINQIVQIQQPRKLLEIARFCTPATSKLSLYHMQIFATITRLNKETGAKVVS